jgi:hypothetical protein
MIPKPLLRLLMLGAALTAAGCATPDTLSDAQRASCETGAVRLIQDFSTAPDYACERTGDAAFELVVIPEDPDINPSPWYAFDLHAERAGEAQVALEYPQYRHRYQPRIELESGHWAALPEDAVIVSEDRQHATLTWTSPPAQPGSARRK